MIAPLEFIFGGGDDVVEDQMENLETQKGGASEMFSKKCEEIKNKYGVPIGYSCVYTRSSITYNPIEALAAPVEDEIKEIDDDMFDTLFNKAIDGIKTPASTSKKTKKASSPLKQKRRSTKKARTKSH